MNHRLPVLCPWSAVLLLGASLLAQVPSFPETSPPAPGRMPEDRVLFDQPGDGRIWASGTSYKASFGADGFVYVPFLGSQAPRNYPVQFVLRSVRVGAQDLVVRADAVATQTGARVTLDRGPVREVYDLTAASVEQTFVVDGALSGDVEVEVEVVTDLAEDRTREGLQFGNQLGQVEYGTAYLVQGSARTEVPAAFAGRTLTLRVPAAQRGAGPVVIDPIITTRTFAPTLMASEVPDIAYDVTTDRWMVAWIHIFSATDHDVVAELRTASGDPVPGSFKLVDNSTQSFSFPRVANLNSADRFLIAMERIPQVTGQLFTVWGRTVDAATPFGTSSLFEVSQASTVHQNNVDVGGDPGTGTQWTVVWVRGTDVYARQVNANGTLSNNLIPITSSTTQCINPQISISNGNGLTATPCWGIVFNFQSTATDWDVYATTMGLNGSLLVAPRRFASLGNDQFPCVSSPTTDCGSRTGFLVSWARVGTPNEMIARMMDTTTTNIGPEVNLTRRYGFGGDFYRVESDGCRFAAMSQVGTTMQVGTLALVNNDLVMHESLQTIGTGGWPFLASKRSGGGRNTEYGIAYVNTTFTPFRVAISLYQGRASTGGLTQRGTGCGLGINTSGSPFLGETLVFTLNNTRTDLVGLLLGVPMAGAQVCESCFLGLDPTLPLSVFAAPFALPLPLDPLLVGISPSVQGFAFGSGPCGGLRLSNTVDFTIQ